MGDVLYKGELVSRPWAVVLRDMAADGVNFDINEARRSLERQQFFWDCGPNGCCCCNNCNLAARPSIFAPHIRVGRPDHATDFDTLSHNINDVLNWLARKGLKPSRPAGAGTDRWEAWHVEISMIALIRYYRKHKGDKFDKLPRHVERAVRAFIASKKTVRDRVEARDKIDSHKEPKKWEARDRLVDKAVDVRSKHRAKVEQLLRRSKKANVRRILREVLK
jgi:hypothetical protein